MVSMFDLEVSNSGSETESESGSERHNHSDNCTLNPVDDFH